jgi:hypothetical protein
MDYFFFRDRLKGFLRDSCGLSGCEHAIGL